MLLKILNEGDIVSASALLSPNYSNRKLLLTSNGFENPRLGKLFLDIINIQPNKIRVLFITTAAIDTESKSILPECYNELYRLGIEEDNITTINDLNHLSLKDLSTNYDVIYMAGGDEQYLIDYINNSDFRNTLLSLINDYGKFYIGVSAGTCICSNCVNNSLGIIPNRVDVHCTKDIAIPGNIPSDPRIDINLSSNQAIVINGNIIQIVE